MTIAFIVAYFIFSFFVGMLTGRLYTLNHETRDALRGWKETLEMWKTSLEERDKFVDDLTGKMKLMKL